MKGKKKIIAAIEALKRKQLGNKEVNKASIHMLEWVLDNNMPLFNPVTFDANSIYEISKDMQIIGIKKADK